MLSDDLISAYLDDELDDERRAMVEQHLRFDTGAAARFERLRNADDLLKQAFPAREQTNDELLAAMIVSGDSPKTRSWMTAAMGLAAAVLLGLVVGQVTQVGNGDRTSFAITAQQARLLDTQESGRVTNTNAGAFEVVLSLRSDAGDVCRQFRLTRDRQSTDVLACRSGDSDWRMVAAAGAPEVEGYVPAGADSPLDAAIRSLGAVEALDTHQEQAMIADKWH